MNDEGTDRMWFDGLGNGVPLPRDIQTARRIHMLLAGAAVIAAKTLEHPSETAIIAVFHALLFPTELSDELPLSADITVH